MKTLTIAQRLKVTLGIIIGLLLAGFILTAWMQSRIDEAEKQAVHQRDTLLRNTALIRLIMMDTSDALRGLLLDPQAAAEKKRKLDGDALMAKIVEETKPLVKDQPGLSKAMIDLENFDDKTLNVLEDRIMQLVVTNQQAANDFYQKSYLSERQKADQLIAEFDRQIQNTGDKDQTKTFVVEIIMVACVLIIIITSLWLGRGLVNAITQPLDRLLGAMQHLQAGNFTNRISLPRHDEFGILAEGLNQTAENLARLAGQAQQAGIQLNTSVTEMAATLKEQQASSSEMAATTMEISSTSKEISATAKELGKTMSSVAAVAEDTAQLASGGQSGLSRLEATMRQVMEATGSIAAKLALLSEKTANINSVVTTINKVADQTNLLSLNAAIEAEKAGEFGQGFAVVATEIRRLADQTAVATYDIEQMVKEMQSAVAAGVMGMDKFSEEVRRGVEEVKQVTAQLAQIIQQVQTLTPRFESVNDGMQSQSAAAGQISEALSQLGETAQQSAEAIVQNAEVVERLTASARGLQDAVSLFRVK
ncbi:MAG: methyl-accepting chemotaxis protein [Verrucomicrobiota bacterium]